MAAQISQEEAVINVVECVTHQVSILGLCDDDNDDDDRTWLWHGRFR
jgi:hypothetical protein